MVDTYAMRGTNTAPRLYLRRISALLLAASFVLLIWIIYLGQALPSSYRAEHWDLAWVGFDIGMFFALLASSWAMWKQRQLAIPGAMISSTFLIIDSWFDVVTSNPGVDFKVAILLAAGVELPAAALLFRFSRSAVRGSIKSAYRQAGVDASSHSLWRTPLMIFESKSD